ncbi:unnamed protein product [Clonostachys rosea f. rosea IK726]|uniref:Uncharacterized protein n=1 Tax=Clonostachys rosea f. rosea IK726 TaxID=1349383 RepID=A0ACA9TZR7_BIOOC|nr:unnamed protein product [Clonostachys rosea f. rosea IK726]
MAPQRTMRLEVDNEQHASGSQPLGQPRRRQHRVVEVVEAHPDARKVEARELGAREERRRLLVLGDEVAQTSSDDLALYLSIMVSETSTPMHSLAWSERACIFPLKTYVGEESRPAGVVEDSPAGPHGDEVLVPPELLLQHRQGLSELLVIVGAQFTSQAYSVSNRVIRSGQKRGWTYLK